MKNFSRLSLRGALLASFLLIGTIPAFAQCDENDPNCPIDPPQSVEVDPNSVESEGSTTDIEDPGALEAVESDITGAGPAIIDPVPLAPRAGIAPAFGKLTIPMRWQQPTDVSCGVQALGMAFEGLGDGSPSSPLILEHLQTNNMIYDFGTGVEELAFSAQNFGYKGTIPFHNWGLGQLQAELVEGRAPVVALGANGPGQPGHFVTITGFSPDGQWASYNDPILGEQVVAIDEFNRLWGLQGNTGVAVRKTVPAGEFDPVPWVAFVAGLMALISQTPWALQRKGIGGRLVAGGSTSRRKTKPARKPSFASLGGVPSRAAKAAARRKPRRSRPVSSTPPSRDPSPQMFNTAPPPMQWKKKLQNDEPEGTPTPPAPETPPVATPTSTPPPPGYEIEVPSIEASSMEIYPTPMPGYAPGEREREDAERAAIQFKLARLEQAQLEFEHTEPFEYIRHNVYWANGIDYISMAMNMQDNELTFEFINDNSKYPGSMRPVIAMNLADGENLDLLREFDMDVKHIPNYEPVFLDALRTFRDNQYDPTYKFYEDEGYMELNLWESFKKELAGEGWKEAWKILLKPGYGSGTQ